jgi:TRAP-type C4-dicarboxylate transport system substrate-binding protein
MSMRRWHVILLALMIVNGLSRPSAAEPGRQLRFATVAPDGSAWAHEMKSFARDLLARTHGELGIKWYFGGVAGDELEMAERMRRGQLDGVASGGMLCQALAPSMRVLSLPGLFQGRGESAHVVERLWPDIDRELAVQGLVNLGLYCLGSHVILSRRPIRNMDELRRTRLWVWDLDRAEIESLRAMGLSVVPLPLEAASRAYDRGTLDGFVTLPTSAITFQWYAQARYATDLRVDFLVGCLVVAERALDPLPFAERQSLRAALATGAERVAELGRKQDEALMGGLFAQTGLSPIAIAESFRAQFFEAARQARARLQERIVTQGLLARVTAWLADYRAEHAKIDN